MKKSDIVLGLSAIAAFCVGKSGSASFEQTSSALAQANQMAELLNLKLKKSMLELEIWMEKHPQATEWDGDQFEWSQIKNIALPDYTKSLGYSTLAEYYQALKEVVSAGFDSVAEAYDYGKNLSQQQVEQSSNVQLQQVTTHWLEVPPDDIVAKALTEPLYYQQEIIEKLLASIDSGLATLDKATMRSVLTLIQGDKE